MIEGRETQIKGKRRAGKSGAGGGVSAASYLLGAFMSQPAQTKSRVSSEPRLAPGQITKTRLGRVNVRELRPCLSRPKHLSPRHA